MKQYDVIIIGGGMVGLTFAALLIKNNFSVAVVESKKNELHDGELTARVSAIHATSQKLLSYLDIWKCLSENAAPLHTMKIWDHTESAHLEFDSDSTNEIAMGWIVENRKIISALQKKLSGVDFYAPHFPKEYSREKNSIILTLDNDKTLEAKLIVGADGAKSWVREQMSVEMKTRSYFQKSIIAVIESEKSHHNIAYQKFLKTGPVALLPLKNKYHTALVWSADDLISDELMKKSAEDFSLALTQALDFKLGKLKTLSNHAQFNLTMRHATEYASENFALIGDAAHTIHPLAGLGVNLGLMDAACLTQVLCEARAEKKSISDLRVLRRYTRWRKSENTSVICAMRALKEIFSLDSVAINMIRSFGVNAIDSCEPIKNKLTQVAMGQSKELPVFLNEI